MDVCKKFIELFIWTVENFYSDSENTHNTDLIKLITQFTKIYEHCTHTSNLDLSIKKTIYKALAKLISVFHVVIFSAQEKDLLKSCFYLLNIICNYSSDPHIEQIDFEVTLKS